MEAQILSNHEIDPGEWDTFIAHSPQGAIYTQYGYITAVCGRWQALVVMDGPTWEAVMPLWITRKGPYLRVPQAPFTQYWGICFASRTFHQTYKAYSWKQAVVSLAVAHLQPYDWFQLHFAPSFDYPLPFHWAGYTLQARYTYQLPLAGTPAEIFAAFAGPLQRQIRKAQRAEVSIRASEDLSVLADLIRRQEASGNLILDKNPAYYKVLEAVHDFLRQGESPVLKVALDAQGTVLAAGLFGSYRCRQYYLIGAYAPEHRNSGAMSLLMWHQIQQAIAKGDRVFDFEGSMIQGVEAFFRKFGASPVSYLSISRNRLPFFVKWMHALLS